MMKLRTFLYQIDSKSQGEATAPPPCDRLWVQIETWFFGLIHCISQGGIISVNWLLCYRFFEKIKFSGTTKIIFNSSMLIDIDQH